MQGRFVQRDPLGYVDGLGLYEGFWGNPRMVVDPYGLYALTLHLESNQPVQDSVKDEGNTRTVRGSFSETEKEQAKAFIIDEINAAIEEAVKRKEPLDLAFEGHNGEFLRQTFRQVLQELSEQKAFSRVRLRTLTLDYCWSHQTESTEVWYSETSERWFRWFNDLGLKYHFFYDFYFEQLGVEWLVTTTCTINMNVTTMFYCSGYEVATTWRWNSKTPSLVIESRDGTQIIHNFGTLNSDLFSNKFSGANIPFNLNNFLLSLDEHDFFYRSFLTNPLIQFEHDFFYRSFLTNPLIQFE